MARVRLGCGPDDATKVLILTGQGDYYSAGVNLSGTMRLEHPKRLHAFIVEHNEALFRLFIDFPTHPAWSRLLT